MALASFSLDREHDRDFGLEASRATPAPSTTIPGVSAAYAKLLALTKQRLKDLSAAEEKLIAGAAGGGDVDCSARSKRRQECPRGVVCARLIEDLDAAKLVTTRGISISGATVRAPLLWNLQLLSLSGIVNSFFEDLVDLQETHLL